MKPDRALGKQNLRLKVIHTLDINRLGLRSYLKGQRFKQGFRIKQPQVYGAAERKEAIMCSGCTETAEV